jgi:hypothetical protein
MTVSPIRAADHYFNISMMRWAPDGAQATRERSQSAASKSWDVGLGEAGRDRLGCAGERTPRDRLFLQSIYFALREREHEVTQFKRSMTLKRTDECAEDTSSSYNLSVLGVFSGAVDLLKLSSQPLGFDAHGNKGTISAGRAFTSENKMPRKKSELRLQLGPWIRYRGLTQEARRTHGNCRALPA